MRVRWTRAIPPLAAAMVAIFVVFASSDARAQGWATAQAIELTRQGHEHEAKGDLDTAHRRYLDAVAFDATYGAAYLALGGIEERLGDAREAERSYSVGIEHVNGFADAFIARARLRARQRRAIEAASDLEQASSMRPDDVAVMRELAGTYVASSACPAALATMRRMAAIAEENHDASAMQEAKIATRALSILVSDVDPVASGLRSRGAVRSAIAMRATGRIPDAKKPR